MQKSEFVRKFAQAVTGVAVAHPPTRLDAVLIAFAEAKKQGIFAGHELIDELKARGENLLVKAIAEVYGHSRDSTVGMWAVGFLLLENIESAWEYYQKHAPSE